MPGGFGPPHTGLIVEYRKAPGHGMPRTWGAPHLDGLGSMPSWPTRLTRTVEARDLRGTSREDKVIAHHTNGGHNDHS
jgi:hypothetical protein